MPAKKSLPVVTIRLKTDRRILSDEQLTSPELAVNMIRREMGEYAREVFMVLYMDNSCHPISVGMISAGSQTGAHVSPVQVFQTAYLCNASCLILFHNHPGLTLAASDDDIYTTKRLIACGQLLGVKVLDHIIVAGDKYMSMKENETLDFDRNQPIDDLLKTAEVPDIKTERQR